MGRKLANTTQRYPQPINLEATKVIKLKLTPQAKTPAQEYYMESLRDASLTVGTGPAGSGKSFLSMAIGIEKLLSNEVSKIVLTRPVCEAGESLGFLPGTFEEKISPYLRPLLDALEELVGVTMAKKLMDGGKIEFAPLAYMRGRTFNNCVPADHVVVLANGAKIRMDALLEGFNQGEKFEVLTMNTHTGAEEVKPIQAAFVQPNQHKRLVVVTLEGGAVIRATPDHKLYTTNRGYVAVNELNMLDELMALDDEQNPEIRSIRAPIGKSVKIAKIETIDSDDLVYDIMVADNHNFFTNGNVLSSNCYVILDEAQNTTVEQIKLFVTRAGNHSSFVVNGDVTQSDLRGVPENGLEWLVRRLRGRSNMINVIEFGHSDIQRSPLVRELLKHLDGPDERGTEGTAGRRRA